MDYFFYGRDVPDSESLRLEVTEAHWSFMDGYADAMIARGPTLSADRMSATGSMHIVELPDAAAAQRFAFTEPYFRAGIFRDVMIRRWHNSLGGTMWDFDGSAFDDPRFLVIGHGNSDMDAARDALLDDRRGYFVEHGYNERFIARGPLLSDDGKLWAGSVMLVEMSDRGALEAMLADEPFIRAGLYAEVEIHDWQFGGRPTG